MSSKFATNVGYLAARRVLHRNRRYLLTTNLLKGSLRITGAGVNAWSIRSWLAVNCISNIITEDLARDLLLNYQPGHPIRSISGRRRSCVCSLFVKYPQGLRLTFARLQQCLMMLTFGCLCAVNVVTELSDKNSKNICISRRRPVAHAVEQQLDAHQSREIIGSLVPVKSLLSEKTVGTSQEYCQKKHYTNHFCNEAVHTITFLSPVLCQERWNHAQCPGHCHSVCTDAA
jgi:AP-3 complex subunit delta-1